MFSLGDRMARFLLPRSLAAGLCLCATAAAAQAPPGPARRAPDPEGPSPDRSRGTELGVRATVVWVAAGDSLSLAGAGAAGDTGGGLAIRAAFATRGALRLTLGLDILAVATDVDLYSLTAVSAGMRAYAWPSARVAPYMEAGLMRQLAASAVPGAEEPLRAFGHGVTAGGGVLVRLTHEADLDFGVTLGAARFGVPPLSGPPRDRRDRVGARTWAVGLGVVARG